jgi:hypothetical protein
MSFLCSAIHDGKHNPIKSAIPKINIFLDDLISQYCKFDNPTAVMIPIIIQYHVISNNKINIFLKIVNCIVVGLLTSVEIQIDSQIQSNLVTKTNKITGGVLHSSAEDLGFCRRLKLSMLIYYKANIISSQNNVLFPRHS